MSKCSGIRHLTSGIATKQHPFENKHSSSPSSSSPPPRLAMSTSKCYMSPTRFGSRATTTQSVAMFVQAHVCVLAEGDGPRPLCVVPRARPLSQVLKLPRSLVLQLGLSAVPLVNRTSRGVLGQPVHECLRPASEGMQAEGPGICSGTAEGEVSICKTTKKEIVFLLHFRQGV